MNNSSIFERALKRARKANPRVAPRRFAPGLKSRDSESTRQTRPSRFRRRIFTISAIAVSLVHERATHSRAFLPRFTSENGRSWRASGHREMFFKSRTEGAICDFIRETCPGEERATTFRTPWNQTRAGGVSFLATAIKPG